MLEENYNVIGVVKRTTNAKKGVSAGTPIVESDPHSEVSEEYKKIAKLVIESEC